MNDQEGPALTAQTKVEEAQAALAQAKLAEAQAALAQATQVRESIRAYPFFPRSLQQRRQAIIAAENLREAVKDAEDALIICRKDE